MTYFYKIKGTLARKEGGEPPKVDEFVAIGKDNVVRHYKNGELIDEQTIEFPPEAPQNETSLREIYKNGMGYKITKEMLYPMYRKKVPSKKKVKRKYK